MIPSQSVSHRASLSWLKLPELPLDTRQELFILDKKIFAPKSEVSLSDTYDCINKRNIILRTTGVSAPDGGRWAFKLDPHPCNLFHLK